ncbi:hypothetical protein PoB_005512400 [Plakobranchus ocellatus]|uniref:Uncharacterized protein n=1 Tax=Plakobranchus ocellatus TaxID=259542 RepID=A0AAV4CD21_9GAST|nr:hypothetical protein PoB_005512400 [Plakobranchus ocellatus]
MVGMVVVMVVAMSGVAGMLVAILLQMVVVVVMVVVMVVMQQKASLIMVPSVGGAVNRKFASDLKGIFCHGFDLHNRCPGLIEGLQT